jgi:hypothetical protein
VAGDLRIGLRVTPRRYHEGTLRLSIISEVFESLNCAKARILRVSHLGVARVSESQS